MYYRYKTRKKDRRYLKRFFYLIVAAILVYTVYHYRSYLMFWKISHNKIVSEISSVSIIPEHEKRFEKLKELKKDLDIYKKENFLEPESYILSARVCYNLGVSGFDKNFTDIYLSDLNMKLSPESTGYLIESIKNYQKALALLDGKDIEIDDIFILAESYYLVRYYSNEEIYTLLKEYVRDGEGLSSDNVRFFAIICITGGHAEEGLSFLENKGVVEENVKGRLLRAKALKDAMKNTEAIIAFQKILKNTEDSESQKIAYMNLGRIYYGQHLYRESIEQFVAALALGDDNQCRIWIGKSYFAAGDKDKAKSVWEEVLNADNTNEEVKKLLGIF